VSNISYDFENEIWHDSSKTKLFYALDWRGQGEPTETVETPARILHNNGVITRIEFDNVPEGIQTVKDGSDEAVKHQRESGALVERERIIKLLEEQYDNFDENGRCVYLRHMPECCNCDLIAFIKGENK
jgi:hypothetical protein